MFILNYYFSILNGNSPFSMYMYTKTENEQKKYKCRVIRLFKKNRTWNSFNQIFYYVIWLYETYVFDYDTTKARKKSWGNNLDLSIYE